ncbi:MAG: hypothetical protein ACRDYA_08995 [Egibacteraceae bacterium]
MNQITGSRPPAVMAAATLVFGLAIYAALLSVGHLGVEVPVLSALGPGGSRVVLVAGIVFAVGALVYAVIGIGLLRLHGWAWAAGVVVSALGVLSGIGQFRGAGSLVGILLSLAVLLVLLTPQARAQLRRQRER